MGKYINYAKLSKEDMEKIKNLEKKIGACLLAYKVVDGPDVKSLSEADLEDLKNLERELGLSLVAYPEGDKGKGAA